MIKVVACQYELEELSWDLYVKKMEFIILAAKQKDAQLVVLPEYSGLEVGGVFESDKELFAAIQSKLPQYLKLFKQLAEQYQIYIQAGSIPVEVSSGKYANRAYFFGLNGVQGYQDKLQLVEYEKKGLLIKGTEQTIFETSIGKVGIAVCYDSEFPEIIRRLTLAGAEIILVPSYCVSLASYNRVAISCRARAIENQCYVVTSYVIGEVKLGSVEAEFASGQSAIFSPSDIGFPDNGIIAKGTINETAIVEAELDLEELARVRQNGDVRNFADINDYESNTLPEIKTLSL